MPATIIGNNEWNTRGLVLTRQDAQEQVNGLVTVQVEYVGPSTKHDQLSRNFFTDAPPPIWPSVVNRDELLTNRLYMESRTFTRANGLTTVRANYVGGLVRAGFDGYYLREEKEPGKRATAYRYVSGDTLFTQDLATGVTIALAASFVFPPTGAPFRRADAGTEFIYDEKIKSVQFVRIGGQSSVRLPTFFRNDCASLVSQQASSFGFGVVGGSGTTAALSAEAANADLWVVPGDSSLLGSGILSFEKNTPVPSTEQTSYITPLVELVTLRHSLTR